MLKNNYACFKTQVLRFMTQNHVNMHYVKSVQIRSFFLSVFSYFPTEYGDLRSKFSPNTGKYGPEKNPYLDTFHAVMRKIFKYFVTLIKH